MVRIRWMKSAKEDLREIYQYIASDSKRYARLQVERIQNRTHILKTHIRIGRVVREIADESIREISEGNYRIIYRIIDEQNIDILMIHHSARDLKRRVK